MEYIHLNPSMPKTIVDLHAVGDVFDLPPDYEKTGYYRHLMHTCTSEEARAKLDESNRARLARAVERFHSPQFFGPDTAQVHCIMPGPDLGVQQYAVPSSGYSWIGVKTHDKICIVSMIDPVCKRTSDKAQGLAYYLLKCALSDMMGGTTTPGRMLPPVAPAHLAVVSVAPAGGHRGLTVQESEGAYRAINLIRAFFHENRFLSSLSYEEIRQLAVTALEAMGQNFNMKMIKVCGWGNGSKGDGEVLGMTEEHVRQAINTFKLKKL